MTVSLLEILAAARVHAAPLAAESAGYLMLAVADHVVSAPRAVKPDEVELTPDGNVRLRARLGVGVDAAAEPALRRLLAHTLEVSSSVGPALRRAAQRSEDAGLTALVRELEIALIPVNRSAAKRALSRVHRETERARSTGKLAGWVDAELGLLKPAPIVALSPSVGVAPAPEAVGVARAAAVEVAPVAAVEVAPVAAVVFSPVGVAESVEVAPVAPGVAAPVDVSVDELVTTEPAEWGVPDLSPPAQPVTPVDAPLPPVAAVPPRGPRTVVVAPAELTPEPGLAVAEPAFTKPEPVVQRAKERGNATPRLGTLVTLQTLAGEESERTERAPAVVAHDELDLSIDVELELEPEKSPLVAAVALQPLSDPEPSRMPDVLTAMLELHTGVDADEAPTRLRDVVTEPRVLSAAIAPTPRLDWSVTVVVSPQPLPEVEPPAPLVGAIDVPVTNAVVTPVPVAVATPTPAAAVSVTPVLTPEPELVDDTWLTHSSLSAIESAPRTFVSEQVDPALHDALTWNPGPVAARAPLVPPALTIAEPLPEPSPYAPAVLSLPSSDVSELLDSFYVSGAPDERDLRSALKGMAGLELTPMPHPYVEEG